jgi:hypothetical protein
MKTWVRRTARVGILSAGFLLIGATAASAAPEAISAPGALNDVQAVAPANAASNVEGVATALVKSTAAGVGSGAAQENAENVTDGGILNNPMIVAPIKVPVNVCGDAVAVLGQAVGVCEDAGAGESATAPQSPEAAKSEGGVANNATVAAPITVPVDVCGTAVAVLGTAVGECNTPPSASYPRPLSGAAVAGEAAESAAANPTGNVLPDSAASSAQQASPELLNTATSPCSPCTVTPPTTTCDAGCGGGLLSGGVLNNASVAAPVTVPVNVSGVGVDVLGKGLSGLTGTLSGGCGSAVPLASSLLEHA